VNFPKSARLLTKAQFQSVIRSGRRFVGVGIVIDWRQGDASRPKLGITVSKRFGKAHDRNRFKRLIREVFRATAPNMPSGLEINVIPRRPGTIFKKMALESDFARFIASLIP